MNLPRFNKKVARMIATRLMPAEKVTGAFCAKHPKGRSGKRCLSPFP
jgi:hypothetical protein